MVTQNRNPDTTFRKTTLDSGIRVVTSEMPHARSVSVGIFIGVGSRYETAEQAGISHFIEHLVSRAPVDGLRQSRSAKPSRGSAAC